MKSCSVLLVILLSATSCAHRTIARPVVAVVATPSSDGAQPDGEGGVAAVEYHGIPGLFFTFEAWRDVLIRFRLQQKDLQVSLATETVAREIAEVEAKRLRESQSRSQWAATYGPWLGFAGGLTAAGIIAAIFGGVFGGLRK